MTGKLKIKNTHIENLCLKIVLLNRMLKIFVETSRNNAVTPMNQVLTCLRCYATGGHLSSVADFMGLAISTTSRTIQKVSQAIASLSPQYITLPVGEEQRHSTGRSFFSIASFPRVLGCVDGTHIRIQSPGQYIFIKR